MGSAQKRPRLGIQRPQRLGDCQGSTDRLACAALGNAARAAALLHLVQNSPQRGTHPWGLPRPGSVKLRSCLNELAVDTRHWATLAPRRRRTQYKCTARQSVQPNSI